MLKESLRQFFKEVGHLHASFVLQNLKPYIPLMRRFPEITAQEIHRFRHYLVKAPAHNHEAALECLIIIAKEVPEVRPQIIEDLGDVLYEYYPIWKEVDPEGTRCEELLRILEIPLSERDKLLRELARSVITLHRPLILVIGAGFSYDTMPITDELQHIFQLGRLN